MDEDLLAQLGGQSEEMLMGSLSTAIGIGTNLSQDGHWIPEV